MNTHRNIGDGITLVKFNPNINGDMRIGIAHCYRQVFAEHPWSEWKKCRTCGKKWGFENIHDLSSLGFIHCGVIVEDFWPIDGVIADFDRENSHDSSCWFLIDHHGHVVAFIWGFSSDISSIRHKVDLDFRHDILGSVDGNQVAYLDEVGVQANLRGKGLASVLYNAWLKDMLSLGCAAVVARTQGDPKPTVLYHWFLDKGYEIVGQYPRGHSHELDVILAIGITT